MTRQHISGGLMRDKSTWAIIALLVLSLGVFIERNYLPATEVVAEDIIVDAYIENWREVQKLGVSSKPEAKVQLIEFVDYECPICQRFYHTLDTLQQKYDIGVTMIHFPLDMHRFAVRLANMAECARVQGKFAEMNHLLYARFDSIGMKPLAEYGKTAGIKDVRQWTACVETNGSKKVIDAHLAKVKELNITGTPTIVVNGRRLTVPPTVYRVSSVIDSILQGIPLSSKEQN